MNRVAFAPDERAFEPRGVLGVRKTVTGFCDDDDDSKSRCARRRTCIQVTFVL